LGEEIRDLSREIHDCDKEIHDLREEIHDCDEEIHDSGEEIHDCECKQTPQVQKQSAVSLQVLPFAPGTNQN